MLVIVSATIAVVAAFPQPPPPPPHQDNSALAAASPTHIPHNSALMNAAVQQDHSAKANQYSVLACSNAFWAGYDYISLCILGKYTSTLMLTFAHILFSCMTSLGPFAIIHVYIHITADAQASPCQAGWLNIKYIYIC